jgi:hypothetical protein
MVVEFRDLSRLESRAGETSGGLGGRNRPARALATYGKRRGSEKGGIRTHKPIGLAHKHFYSRDSGLAADLSSKLAAGDSSPSKLRQSVDNYYRP